MKLSELMQKYHYKEYDMLKEKFPDMYHFAKEVEVVEWKDEYAIADHNPEQIEAHDFLRMLHQNGLITDEEYRKEIEKFKGYASRTLAIAFIDEKKVSFREAVPKPSMVIHELGHIYFEVNDLIWNMTYAGGEILLWLALKDRYTITEGHIRRYHELIRQVYEDTEAVHKYITGRIAHRLKVYPHLFPICLYMGYIPEYNFSEIPELFHDLNTPKWAQVQVTKHHIFSFFQNITEGLKWNDSYCCQFAKWLEIIGGKK